MAVKPIRQLGDPVLWARSDAVADPTAHSIAGLAEDLRDTLLAFRERHGYGRGIAAPQIGVLQRVIAIDAPAAQFAAFLVNPRITSESKERVTLWDVCFSFSDLLVEVSRAASVAVEYTGLDGAGYSLRATGELSELLQHEIDHLDGILALQRAISARSWCTREEWERQRRGA